MKKNLFFLAALGAIALTSCTNDEFVGDNSPNAIQESTDGAIMFGLKVPNMTRGVGDPYVGATAAEKLGNMFVVEGTKGTEATDAPSSTVVFDNYLVLYSANTAGTTESNTHNWEYVGKQTGLAGKLTGATWGLLHPSGSGVATAQTVKYWDYTTSQYDFIAWSTGNREAVTTAPSSGTSVQVTRINTGTTLKTNGFQMTALSANDLKECYYTDINKVPNSSYGEPVTLTFRNMAAKVRVAFYETVPGYSVKNLQFFQADGTALNADVSTNPATLYTASGAGNELPQSGTVTVIYPRIGSANSAAADYNKASVLVAAGSTTSSTQTFGTLPNANLGTTLPTATFAGDAADGYYQAVIPNTDGKVLTLRVNYTLVSDDGSNEQINVYGAKAVVPATYTNWLPNYAYTYVFKISDNTNGWTENTGSSVQGLHPITFDAVVTSFVDANAEQTTVTTVATPSITTYQQGHNEGTNGAFTVPDEYDNDGAKLYVKVMDGGTPVTGLSSSNSLFFLVETTGTTISEATVMDALQNRTNDKDATSPIGRNGITLTAQTNGADKVIDNTVTKIVNGVDNQPISVTAGDVAAINLAGLEGTYAYVYVVTGPTADEKIYHVAADASTYPTKYYEVELSGSEDPLASGSAAADKVYFVKNVDKNGAFVSYTFKQTKVGDDVTGLVEADIPAGKAGSYKTNSAGHNYFYFDVYNQNNGAYAVKVIKVVN